MSRPLVLRLTDAAEADLASIWSFVAADRSEEAADRVIGRIEAACGTVCNFPQAGPLCETLAPGLRVTFEGRYAIYYIYDETALMIVRVLHGARDLAALWDQGGSS